MNKQTNIWMPYAQMQTAPPPLEVVKTQGAYLYLKDGTRLIDGIASWWTACHGYQHPHILEAINTQSQTLSHVMLGGLIHPQVTRLCERLTQLLPEPLAHVMLSESGSVAVEIALKMALQYWQQVGKTKKRQFAFLKNDYHGDTLYTMGLCDPENGMHRFFQSQLPPQQRITLPATEKEWDALNDWLAMHHETLAGIVVEPLIQGAIGMAVYAPAQLKQLCALCHRYSILVIMDEIFTGFYRTGSCFAFEQAQVIPDIVCLSKALTGGVLPLAATIAHQKIYDAFLSPHPEHALMHGTTFMGNALACAAANASLDLFEQNDYAAQVQRIEKQLTQGFSSLKHDDHITDVRIKGAMGAIELKKASPQTMLAHQQAFQAAGIFLRPINNVFYTTPALNIQDDLLERLIHVMVKQLSTHILTPSISQKGVPA